MSQITVLKKVISGSLLGGVGLLASTSALPFAFEVGEIEGSLDTLMSAGARWRASDRDVRFIGKTNVDPTQCPRASVGCLVSGHDEFVNDARGLFGPNTDNGNLNYEQYEVVQGVAKITTDFSLKWRNFGSFVRGYAFYDVANDDFDEFHPDGLNDSPDAFQPTFTKRLRDVEDASVFRREILDAYIYGDFEFGDHVLSIKYGEQVVSWGESLVLAVGSLNTINPPSVTRLFTPGLDLKEIFGAVELVHASINITENLSAEAWYQFDFEPADVDSVGTFFSGADITQAGARYAMLSFGKAHEDPSNAADTLNPVDFATGDNFTDDSPELTAGCIDTEGADLGMMGEIEDNAAVASGRSGKDGFNNDPTPSNGFNSSVANAERGGAFGRTICVLDQEGFFPDEDGQFGVAAKYYSEAINDTEFGFYYANYHSRFPLAGVFAANVGIELPGAATDVFSAVGGLGLPIPNVNLAPVLGALGESDSLSLVLAYPKDIKMYGISFNTNVGDLSLSGEYAYRENLPLQILAADVVLAGEAPAFQSSRSTAAPSCIELYRNPNYDGLCMNPDGTVPDEAVAILQQAPMGRSPGGNRRDFDGYLEGDVSSGTFGELFPGDFVPGWERFPVGQGDIVMLYSAPPALLGADQWIAVAEIGFTNVFGLPSPDVLPLNGPNTDTHRLVGRQECEDRIGTGNECYGDTTAVVLPVDQTVTTATALAIQNPTRQLDGFPTAFSWGLRQLNLISYNNLFAGFNLQAIVGVFWDINGISPGPGGNFVEGRKQWLFINNFSRGSWTYTLGYQGSTGAGDQNVNRDRDNYQLGVKYQF